MELKVPTLLVEGGSGLDPLAFDPSAFLLSLIIFLVLFALLLKYAWNPILDALDAREKRIEDSMAAAEKARSEAADVLSEHQAKMSEAAKEVAELLEKGRAMSQRQGDEILEKAREEAQRERDSVFSDIEIEKQKALGQIRGEAVTIAKQISEKVLSRNLDEGDYRRLADEVLEQMK